MPDFESRLPVGSSASRILGRFTIARAIATRWRSPPESWSGRWSLRPLKPDRGERLVDAAAPLGAPHAAEEERQLDVAGGGQARHQMEELEDEADLLAADAGELLVRRAGRPRGRRGGRSRRWADRGSR